MALTGHLSTQDGKLNRPRRRWWTATDATKTEVTGKYHRTVARATTLAKLKVNLAKYLAAENATSA